MKIITAKTAGFCMGVKRAIKIAINTNKFNKTNTYTYGPLIHNEKVLTFLKKIKKSS